MWKYMDFVNQYLHGDVMKLWTLLAAKDYIHFINWKIHLACVNSFIINLQKLGLFQDYV
jgi:hypothetical protein